MTDKDTDISKIVFVFVLVLSIITGSFLVGLYSGSKKNFLFQFVQNVRDAVVLTIEEAPTLTGTRPHGHLQPAKYDGEGVTVNQVQGSDLVLLSGFFGDSTGARLVSRDGTIVADWPVSFSELFPDTSHVLQEVPSTDWNADIHGALLLPDGSIVFNFEYLGMVKLDRCGEVAWTLDEPVHHSVEIAEGGGFWTSGRYRVAEGMESPYPPFNPEYDVDTVMKVSDDGKVLTEFSVMDLFYDSGLATLLTATGASFNQNTRDAELLHVNKVAELPSSIAGDFPLFSSGDLALSIREANMVLVVNPETKKIVWWRIGPWIRQHDPEFKAGGTISVFNNNLYRAALGQTDGYDISLPTIPRVSNILEIDPVTDEVRKIYGERAGQEMLSVIRGKHENTPEGGLLITEFEGGRVFETDRHSEIIWEYVNRYDEETVAEITEARVYPESYFDVSDWSCRGEIPDSRT